MTEEEFKRAAGQFGLDHPQFDALPQERRKAGDKEAAEEVRAAIDKYNTMASSGARPETLDGLREAVVAHQTAWTLARAAQNNDALKQLGLLPGVPGGGGEAPKEPPPQPPLTLGKREPRPRRQLIFHDVANSSVVKARAVRR